MLDDSRLVDGVTDWWTVWASVWLMDRLFGLLERSFFHHREGRLLVSPSLTDWHRKGHESWGEM